MTKSKDVKETPLMRQYNAIKKKYPGALLLFRVGDFYETFGEDAIKASKILDIVLTKRANGAASHIELAGFPHHALDTYLPKLVKAGNRVAICDQLEDPKSVKGIVKRGVTELITPGLSYNDNVLEKKSNNFLSALHFGKEQIGVAFLDLSTGEFLITQGREDYISKLFQGFSPIEIIFSKPDYERIIDTIGDDYHFYSLEEWIFGYDFAFEKLTAHFGTSSLKGFGIDKLDEAIVAAGAILQYLEATEHHKIDHISVISRIDKNQYVWLDKFTIKNLELIQAQHDGIPLIDILDKTETPMGSRMIKKWLILPLNNIEMISERHQILEAFKDDLDLFEVIQNNLKRIGDLERIISKVAVGRVNPREMIHLKNSLISIQPIIKYLKKSKIRTLNELADKLNLCESLLEKIQNVLKDDVSIHSNQGNIIKNGYHDELDELRTIAFSGKDYLIQIQKREAEKTGISSLKIAFNKVFGYYLEVSNVHKNKVPPEWIRKQTLVNAERYITEELKVYEEKILNAEEELTIIEQKLYFKLVTLASGFVQQIQQNAKILAKIDCLLSFAFIAKNNNYNKPTINNSTKINILQGRHPVIERQLTAEQSYIPNDVSLSNEDQQIMVITGPNMAGKSAILRQTALIVLMAQIGSFVPCQEAEIGIVDKIYTRVGASDNLSKGESTFMVEMIETASILNNLSERSLVLMDEIGRGTSTYDGVSIAWSILEYLHNSTPHRPKTMFATHYHELNQLSSDFERIKNYNVSVKEIDGKIIFLRKLQKGGIAHSFGIHVAQLAGMPKNIVKRANEILKFLEKNKKNEQKKIESIPKTNYQMHLFAKDPKIELITDTLDKIDINTISPVESLLKLNELKKILSNKEK